MKFVLVSDIHQDQNPWDWDILEPFRSESNTLVVAGDISNDIWEVSHWVTKAKRRFENVIWVAGNHDFYNLGFHRTRLVDLQSKWSNPSNVAEISEHYQQWSREHGVIFLNRSSVLIDDVRFIGATGWHDYQAGEPYPSDDQIRAWYEVLNDRTIIWTQESRSPNHLDPYLAGLADLQYLQEEVAKSMLPTVIITHHLPHRRLVHQRPYDPIWTRLHGSFVNTALEGVQHPSIRFWLYGHTHQRNMIDIGNITYVCNARGYRQENTNWSPIVLEA